MWNTYDVITVEDRKFMSLANAFKDRRDRTTVWHEEWDVIVDDRSDPSHSAIVVRGYSGANVPECSRMTKSGILGDRRGVVLRTFYFLLFLHLTYDESLRSRNDSF
jgi:hypothetical protein